MSDRRFTEEEFALILRTATEIQAQRRGADGVPGTGAGSSLEEIQAIAREVGIDPDAVAAAAARLSAGQGAREGFLTTHYQLSDSVPGRLSDESRVAVLQAIREAAEHHGEADVTGPGLEWSSARGETTRFHVSAYTVGERQELRVSVDRNATAILTHFLPTMAGFVASMGIASAVSPPSAWAGAAIVAGGVGGGFTLGRTIWRATARKSRERAERILAAARGALGVGGSREEDG